MAGIELYAPRKLSHRRTWSLAAVVLALVFIIGGQIIATLVGLPLGFNLIESTNGWRELAYTLVAAFGLTALMVFAWVWLFERRGLATIGFNSHGLMRFWRGYGFGLLTLLVTVGAIWALGGYSIEAGGAFQSANVGAALIPIVILFLGFIIQGSTEEIVCRGWLMQLLASRHGLWVAVILNSVLFGLLHGLNIAPSKELYLGLVNIVLFGLFISLYAAREGSLWGVCGWHAAWNWLLGLGFGLEVSGQVINTQPLITDLATNTDVAWWITGAAFGPEASVITTLVLGAQIAWLVLRGKTRDYGVEVPVEIVEAEVVVAER